MSIRQRIQLWWRRRRLKRGYAKIAYAELGKRHGFTPIMRQWELLERDGYIELRDGEIEWQGKLAKNSD